MPDALGVLRAACLVLLSGCLSASKQKPMSELSRMLDTPAEVERAMRGLDENTLLESAAHDPRLRGRWVNRVGYAGPGPEIVFDDGGRYRCHDQEGEYFTLDAAGANWLYRIIRYKNSVGRSLQIYIIDGNQMFIRFQRRDAPWEVWERVGDD
jgi:hypothetical protein